jgi:hypothetical protein
LDIKKWFWTVLGAGINVLGDVAIGIIVLSIVAKLMNVDVLWYFYLPAAFPFIGFSSLPDIDIVLKIGGRGRIDESHRAITHLPLVVIPVVCFVTCFVCFLVGANVLFWFLVSFFSLCLHYLHDSIGRDVDFGIKWLWPFFTLQPMKFFTKEGGQWHLVYIFSGEEQKRPTDDIHQWARKCYLRPTREMGVTALLVIAAIIALYFTL